MGLEPPGIYEYFLDNFWFKSVGLENVIINEPLRGSHKSDIKYYNNDGIAPGNNKSVSKLILKELVETFPPLKGIRVDHAWGGPPAATLDFVPSVGVMGDHKNIYYGVGYNEGVPSAQTGGKMIAELMAGEKNEFTEHFIINRNLPYSGPRFLRSFFNILRKWYMVNVIKNAGHL